MRSSRLNWDPVNRSQMLLSYFDVVYCISLGPHPQLHWNPPTLLGPTNCHACLSYVTFGAPNSVWMNALHNSTSGWGRPPIPPSCCVPHELPNNFAIYSRCHIFFATLSTSFRNPPLEVVHHFGWWAMPFHRDEVGQNIIPAKLLGII